MGAQGCKELCSLFDSRRSAEAEPARTPVFGSFGHTAYDPYAGPQGYEQPSWQRPSAQFPPPVAPGCVRPPPANWQWSHPPVQHTWVQGPTVHFSSTGVASSDYGHHVGWNTGDGMQTEQALHEAMDKFAAEVFRASGNQPEMNFFSGPGVTRHTWASNGRSHAAQPASSASARTVDVELAERFSMPSTTKSAKRLSVASDQTLQQLVAASSKLQDLEREVIAVEHDLAAGRTSGGAAKQRLAQVETQAKNLEAHGVDDLGTGDLHSGRQQAKDMKRDMLQRLEQLFSRMDALFERLR